MKRVGDHFAFPVMAGNTKREIQVREKKKYLTLRVVKAVSGWPESW